MVKLGTRGNDVFYCLVCGVKGKDSQSLRYITKDSRMFIMNCGECHNKVVVTRLTENG